MVLVVNTEQKQLVFREARDMATGRHRGDGGEWRTQGRGGMSGRWGRMLVVHEEVRCMQSNLIGLYEPLSGAQNKGAEVCVVAIGRYDRPKDVLRTRTRDRIITTRRAIFSMAASVAPKHSPWHMLWRLHEREL